MNLSIYKGNTVKSIFVQLEKTVTKLLENPRQNRMLQKVKSLLTELEKRDLTAHELVKFRKYIDIYEHI